MNQNEKPMLERSYHIPLPMFDTAFRAFQKKYVFPRNIVISAVLAAIAGVYVHAVIKDSSQTLGYLLIIVCLGVILNTWYNTFKLRRTVHTALKEIEQDVYTLSVYEDGLVIRTEDAPKPAAEIVPEEQPSAEAQDTAEEGGFHQLFPEEPVQPEEPIEPTEIPFGRDVKIHEYAEFFMVYLVRRNFYVIPKKDFSEDETASLKELFKL